MSTAWDASTATYDSKTLSTGGGTDASFYLTSDGTKLFVSTNTGSIVKEYTLSTEWDISTASFDQQKAFTTEIASGNLDGLFFKEDGTKLFLLSESLRFVYQYTLSTAWDISTATYDTKSLDLSTNSLLDARGISFSKAGDIIYIASYFNNASRVDEYNLSTAWDISTASYDSKNLVTSSEDGTIGGIYLNSTTSKIYVVGLSNDEIYQYSIDFTPRPSWENK